MTTRPLYTDGNPGPRGVPDDVLQQAFADLRDVRAVASRVGLSERHTRSRLRRLGVELDGAHDEGEYDAYAKPPGADSETVYTRRCLAEDCSDTFQTKHRDQHICPKHRGDRRRDWLPQGVA